MKTQPSPQLVNGYFTRKPIINRTFDILNNIGRIAFFRWNKHTKPEKIRKLLLVHFGSFGDALILTSILDALKSQLPNTEIDLALNRDEYLILRYEEMISNFHVMDNRFGKKYVTGILKTIFDFRNIGKKYDMAICFRSFMDNGVLPLYLSGIAKYIVGFSTGGFSFSIDNIVPWENGIHETEHYRDALMTVCPSIEIGKPRIIYDRDIASTSVKEVLGDLSHYIVVHMGSREKYKTLDIERSKKVLLWLLENTSYRIVLTGTKSEIDFWERLHMSDQRILPVFGEFDIFAFIECIAKSNGVITVDTLAAHVGAMCDVPVISFWSGIADYRQWRPIGNKVHVIRHNVPCSPCFKPCDGVECMHHDISNAIPMFSNLSCDNQL